MEIKQSQFIISAVTPPQYPLTNLPEIAFVGRSNVGKSSLINALTNRRKLVKVSGTPGKTRLVNFFLINNKFYFVDLPGYGYAKISKAAKENWGKVIEDYLTGRTPLVRIVLLIDCRRRPTEDDVIMLNWIRHFGYKTIIVATKIDKIKKSEISKNIAMIKETLSISKFEKITCFSTLKKIGTKELLDRIGESMDGEDVKSEDK